MNIRKLLGLCEHKWKIIRNVRVFGYSGGDIPIYNTIIQECEKCGKLKKFRDY